MTSPEQGPVSYAPAIAAEPTTGLRYEVLRANTQIVFQSSAFGFQAGSHVTAYRPVGRPGPTEAELEADFQLFAAESLELAQLAAPIAHETWPEY